LEVVSVIYGTLDLKNLKILIVDMLYLSQLKGSKQIKGK